jgi:hypothetical protein
MENNDDNYIFASCWNAWYHFIELVLTSHTTWTVYYNKFVLLFWLKEHLQVCSHESSNFYYVCCVLVFGFLYMLLLLLSLQGMRCLEESLLFVSGSSKILVCWGFGNELLIYIGIAVVWWLLWMLVQQYELNVL